MSADSEAKNQLWSNLISEAKSEDNSNLGDSQRDASMDKPKLDDDGKNRLESAGDRPLGDQYTWDICMVFKVGEAKETVKAFDEEKGEKVELPQDEHFKNLTADFVTRLERAGLKTDLYYSVQRDEIYCRIGASEKRLQQEADRIDYDLQLDEERCLEAGKMLDVRLAKATEEHVSEDITEAAWLNLYGKYDQLDEKHVYRQELYKRYQDDELGVRNNSFFTSIDRIKLTVNIVEADSVLNGAEISLTKSMANPENPMIAFFPLHQYRKKESLVKKMEDWKSSFASPLDEIRAYFGEAVALYFAFLTFYNRLLVLPAFIGLIFFLWQMGAGKVDVEAIPVFALFVSVWATIFLELWKRYEARYRVRWGMTKFKEKEQPRPDFKGTWRPSPIDGKRVEYFPLIEKVKRALISQSVIWSLIGVVLASVVAIFVFRKVLVEWDPQWGNILTAFINAIQIQILNVIYGMVSNKLNDYENHRTDSEYENALIAKTFLFKFVNSYNSLFYIAFVKKHDTAVNGCKNGNCLGELQQQLGTIFITLIVVNNALEIGIPILMNKINAKKNEAEASEVERSASGKLFKEKSIPELEYELAPYDGTFSDFDELIIQYGYVTLFVVAFPLAPLLALINNILETRIDSSKLLLLTRRPEPRGAFDIGTWSSIMNIVSFIAVIVNLGIVCFETQLMEDWTDHSDAWEAYVFIGTEHLIFILKFTIAYIVPDEPEDVVIHCARQEYIVNVLINGMEDEEDDAEEKANKGTVAKKVEFDWNGRVSEAIRFTGREWKQTNNFKFIFTNRTNILLPTSVMR